MTERLTDEALDALINKLWASDDANALTNQAARQLEELLAYRRAPASDDFRRGVEVGWDERLKQERNNAEVAASRSLTPPPASRADADLRAALEAMVYAVCGETGFSEAVRRDSGLAYPWPTLDIAEDAARAALPAPRPDERGGGQQSAYGKHVDPYRFEDRDSYNMRVHGLSEDDFP